MQIIVNIKNKELADKIIWFLRLFKDKGVEVLNYQNEDKSEYDEEFIKKHWKEIGMSTHSADRDDDEYLYEAAWKFYNEKHSD